MIKRQKYFSVKIKQICEIKKFLFPTGVKYDEASVLFNFPGIPNPLYYGAVIKLGCLGFTD